MRLPFFSRSDCTSSIRISKNLVALHTRINADLYRAGRYSKINLDHILACLDIQDNNRYNIYVQFSIQYQDRGVNNVKNI